jgi:hypothetical protein
MTNRVGYLIAIILLASPASILAQQGGTRSSGEVLTLDEAISLALHDTVKSRIHSWELRAQDDFGA